MEPEGMSGGGVRWVGSVVWGDGETVKGKMKTSEGGGGIAARPFRLRREEVVPLDSQVMGKRCLEPGKSPPGGTGGGTEVTGHCRG